MTTTILSTKRLPHARRQPGGQWHPGIEVHVRYERGGGVGVAVAGGVLAELGSVPVQAAAAGSGAEGSLAARAPVIRRRWPSRPGLEAWPGGLAWRGFEPLTPSMRKAYCAFGYHW